MTNPLHIPARTDAPIACDMSTAEDTADERLAAYRRLFEHALMRRDRDESAVAFVFRADQGVLETVEHLAHREAACCPFLEYRVETAGHEVTYMLTNPITGDERDSVDAMLDVFYALPDHAGSDMGDLLARMAERGVDVEKTEPERFVLRR